MVTFEIGPNKENYMGCVLPRWVLKNDKKYYFYLLHSQIHFPSGAFVRADIADWGMSITVQAPSVDFNHTVGLCGTFDGNADNEFHNIRGETMNIAMKHKQANEFVEQWR